MNSGEMPICPKHKTSNYWYGDYYCSKCQEEEEMAYQASIGYGFELCLQNCRNYDGDMDGGNCTVLKPPMPVSMCGRRRKCKHYEEVIYNPSDFECYEPYDPWAEFWERFTMSMYHFQMIFDKLERYGYWRRR
jgi:hypothetical protein